MIILVTSEISENDLARAAEDLDGYVKVVVDIQKGILTAGGERHVDGEQLLIQSGSLQQNLWGGGIDLETMGIDYDSMINLRPGQNNPSREVLSPDLRKTMDEIIRRLLR